MFDRLPKSLQGVLYQYLSGPEVLALERLSKRCSQGAKQDYLWRYLTGNTLDVQRGAKGFGDTWKRHYWRNHAATKFMTPEKFNYMMCPIRHFK